MDLVMLVLSVVGLCGSVACLSTGVSMLRHRNGKSVSMSSSKALGVKVENGKGDVLGMLKEMDSKLSGEERTELVVVPEPKEGSND
jgi:hypothetical protein